MHKPVPPVAQVGESCLLLVPYTDSPMLLKRQQDELQKRYGGLPTTPVHLTCQRFFADVRQLSALQTGLLELSAESSAMPIWVYDLAPFHSDFREASVLKARIHTSPSLRSFVKKIEMLLARLDIEPVYPWVSELVTVLENISQTEVEARAYTRKLFTGQRLVLSQIEGPGKFRTLADLKLGCRRPN